MGRRCRQDTIAEIQFAANVQGASRGWTCFRDGAVVDEKMVLVSLGRKISPEELADHGPYDGGDGWHLAVSLQLRSMRTGQECLFKSTSLGGRAAFGELLTTHGLRLASGDSGIPVIELGVSHYTHRRYGLVYEPSFKVVGWLDEYDPGASPAIPSAGPPMPPTHDAAKLEDELRDDEILW